MKRSKSLLEAAQAETDAVKAIDEAAADREYTADEQADRDTRMAKARELIAQAKAAKADEDLSAEVKAFADEIGLAEPDGGAPKAREELAVVRKSLGEMVLSSGEFKAAIDPYRGSDGSIRVPEKSRFSTDPIAVKSLLTGASDTSGGAFVVADQSGIVEMLGRRPLTIRDVISVRRTGSDAVEYVRQTSHTNNAAPVAEATSSALPTQDGSTGPLINNAGGGYKPEGAWAFERDVAVVKTIAEWVPATKRALADVAALEGLINDELSADVAEAEETQIISGNGSGENLDGILHVSGTQSQAFSTDIFETIRKGITKARTVGRVAPNAIGLNPSDVETIELYRDNENRFYGMGPFGFGGTKTLWGIPYFESEAITAGYGVVADWSKAVLWDREQTTVTVTDSHADFFVRNLVAILGEERVAFAVTRPSAFVVADLTA